MANFTLESRAKKLPDIQRTWMYELEIPAIADVTNGIMGDVEDLIIRTRSAVIPERGNQPITSEFMGMVQRFPGKPSFGDSFAVTIEETEDQIVHKGLTAWQNLIFNISPTSISGGQSLRPLKRDVAKDVYLIMYKYNGKEMDKKIRFYNAFVQSVGEVSLAYSGNEAVQYSCQFAYDFWDFA
ncbi:MAG: hypothetical protein ACOCZ5_02305 [bacterium]